VRKKQIIEGWKKAMKDYKPKPLSKEERVRLAKAMSEHNLAQKKSFILP